MGEAKHNSPYSMYEIQQNNDITTGTIVFTVILIFVFYVLTRAFQSCLIIKVLIAYLLTCLIYFLGLLAYAVFKK